MKKIVLASTITAMALSGCAGRDANPVKVIQDGDGRMSCKELRQEIQISQQQLLRLVGDKQKVQGNNTAAVAVGAIVFFPALFFMNVKGAAKEEAKAMQDRMVGLAQRHNEKGCRPPIEVQSMKETEKSVRQTKAAEKAKEAGEAEE